MKTHKQQMDRIHRFLEDRGADLIQIAKTHFRENGRGYLNVCLESNAVHKVGEEVYITEQRNRQIEAAMVGYTENDYKIALYMGNYNPETEAVIVIWIGDLYCVEKITDKFAELLMSLEGVAAH